MSVSVHAMHMRFASQLLAVGGVIACPTEAVWGLSCDPQNSDAVNRLLAIKGRPVSKGLILVAADEQQLAPLLTDLSDDQRQQLSASWPGPNTWLIPHRGLVKPWVHGEHDTVAVRVTDHPVVAALCLAWGSPLVSTSANPAGKEPPKAQAEIDNYFGKTLDYIVPGATGDLDRPTQIRDLASGEVLRV
ncbi:MAG: L-threonylcarbamoyladenylate synthase [Pseudomonadota bacterium]